MAQVIALDRQHGIAMIANFATPNDEDPCVQALTMLADENKKHPENHKKALYCIRPSHRPPLMLRSSNPDGSQTFTAIL